jgi:PAS domain S-box-containing protein
MAQEGIPGESVYHILQTTDGYLWMRTSAGLVRFDGLRFVLTDPEVDGHTVNEPVKAICMGADGELLVRTTSRTLLYKDGIFSDYRPPAPLPDGDIRVIFESKEHEIFIGSDDFIYVIRNGTPTVVQRGTGWIAGFLEGEHGEILIGGAKALYSYRDGTLTPVVSGGGRHSVLTLEKDSEGVSLGALTGLFQLRGQDIEPVEPQLIQGEVNAVLRDREGNRWVGTSNSGLLCIKHGKVISFNDRDGLTDNKVLALYEDREGSLWVGTASGLNRFRDTKLTAFTTKENLPSNQASIAIGTRDGSLYVLCLGGGLARIKDGIVTPITRKDGLTDFYGNGLFESQDGSLWLGAGDHLVQYKNGKFTRHGAPRLANHYISAVSEDDEGLIITDDEALALRYKDGQTYPFTVHGQATPLTGPGNYTFTIYRDPAGTLWFGTVKGLFKFAQGEPPEKSPQPTVTFPVTSISDDGRGNLWLGGRVPGMTRFRIADGHVTRYQKKDGLFDDYPSRILSDDAGNLWISTSNGIFMAPRKGLNDFADGRAATVGTTRYDSSDGMKSSEASSPASQPGGWRTNDGKLWFTTQKGVVMVDPNHLIRNDLVPPVVIEEVVADGKALPRSGNFEVAPGMARIEFHYAGLSLRVPSRVRFKFRLEGYDVEWVEAGSRRVAYYTNLSPGTYRFQVIASNDDGVWNETGASVAFVLHPHFYQTAWFFSLCTIILLGSAVAGQRIYTSQLRTRAEELTRLVGERTKDLQGQKGFLRQVIDTIPNLIFLKDMQGRYTLVNRALADIHGLSMDDVVGKTTQEIVPVSSEVQLFECDDEEVLKTGRERTIKEERLTTADGQVRWLQTVKRPVMGEDGKATHVLGVATDITPRKQIEEELRQAKEAAESANRAKSEFLANMSHEIRTPMNGIIGMAELAMSAEGAEQQEYLALVRSSADALLVILNDILDYSKIEAGKIVLDPQQFDLETLVGDTLKSVALQAHRKGLELSFRLEPDVPAEIIADPVRVRQVLLNLINNAVKFTEKGEVDVTIFVERKPAPSLHFTVRDTGIGIPADKQSRLFKAFEQADSSTTRQFGGTGLGLAISSRLIRLMSGEIWLQSAPGVGSAFHFLLPLVSAPEVAEPSNLQPLDDVRGLPVLIIDDNATNRRILQELSRRWGMLPETAESGAEGLARLDQSAASGHPFRLVLLDQQMPGMDGFEVVRRMRAHSAAAATILMLTSADQGSSTAICREMNLDGYLVKPIRPDDLLAAIRKSLGHSPVEVVRSEVSITSRKPARALRILVAEDSPVNQKLALAMLGKMGHQVTIAGTGREAVAAWNKDRFDLIFMDVQMPEMDGLEATGKIREQERASGSRIPIIAMTAHAMSSDRDRCLNAGMDDHISKPVNSKTLLQVIEKHTTVYAEAPLS